jgi:hypothetical protein
VPRATCPTTNITALLLQIWARIHESLLSDENVVTTPLSHLKIAPKNINALRDLNYLCSTPTVQLGEGFFGLKGWAKYLCDKAARAMSV